MTEANDRRRGVLIAEDISAAIQRNELVIGAAQGRVQGCSYDMTVGTVFWEGQIVPPVGRQFTVPQGGVVSIFTAEELKLPNDVCATAFAINKMSSRGFLVLNPGHVDPGFEGPLTVKALNVRKTPIAIQQGDAIFTVVFEKLDIPAGRYKHNKPRADREREFNAETVESSPSSLSEMIALNNEGPYSTRQEVKELIRDHWMSYVALSLTALAAVAGAASLWLQLRPIDRGSSSEIIAPAQSLPADTNASREGKPPNSVVAPAAATGDSQKTGSDVSSGNAAQNVTQPPK